MKTLITKFKGEISDKTLERYNIISFETSSDYDPTVTNSSIIVKVTERNVVACKSDEDSEITFANPALSTPFTLSPGQITDAVWLRPPKSSKFYIENMDHVSSFNIGDVNLVYPQLGADSKNIRVFGKSSLESLILRRQTGIHGNVKDLAEGVSENATNIIINTITDGNIYGDIKYFGRLTKATRINLDGSNVEGDLAELADLMAANGRESGTMRIQLSGTRCTNSAYPGLVNDVDVTFTDSGWTAQVHQNP